MPRMMTLAPVGAEDFAEEQDAIKRRRLQLEALLAEPKGMTGLAGGLANLALGITKGIHEGNLSEREQDMARRRAAFTQRAFDELPRDIPAQPEVNPSAPPFALETQGGGPPLPSNYAPPAEAAGGMVPKVPSYEHEDATPFLPANPRDWAQWGIRYGGLGPSYAAIGLHGAQKAIDAPIEAEKQRQALAAVAAQKEQDRIAKEREKELDRIAKEKEKAYAAAEQQNRDERTAAQRAEDREFQIRLGASLRPAPERGQMSDVGTSVNGNPVVANTHSGVRYEVINGVPMQTPYAGTVTPKAEQAKAVAAAGAGAKTIADLEAALQAVETNPRLYSTRTAAADYLPDVAGISAKASGLTEEELAQRANIAAMTADVTHSLYGSAFSKGEQVTARSFLITPKDSAEVVKAKLKGRMELERRHLESLPASARASSEQRGGGAAAPNRVTNAAEYNALKPGDTYVGPDGVPRTKK